MKKNVFLSLAIAVVILSGCKMAGETKSGWYIVKLKDESGNFSGKSLLQVNGEALSRGLHQAVLQYHTNYKSATSEETRALFVIITNRRESEDYIIVTTPDENKFKFTVYPGGLIFDMPGASKEEENNSIAVLIELMNQYEELNISQGSHNFMIKTAGFSTE